MKEQDIDKIFKDRQNQLDKMPADGVWDRLERKLDLDDEATISSKSTDTKGNWQWLKAAAVVIAITVPSILLFNHFINDKQSQLAEDNTNENSIEKIRTRSNSITNNRNDSVVNSAPKVALNNNLNSDKFDKQAVVKETIISSAIKKHPVKTTTAIAAKKAIETVYDETEDVIFEKDEIELYVVEEESLPINDEDIEAITIAEVQTKQLPKPVIENIVEVEEIIEESDENNAEIAEMEFEADEYKTKEIVASAPPPPAVLSNKNLSNRDGAAQLESVEPTAAGASPTKGYNTEEAITLSQSKAASAGKVKRAVKAESEAYDMAIDDAIYMREEISESDFKPNNSNFTTNSRPFADYGTSSTVSPFMWLVQNYTVEELGTNMSIKQVTDQKLKAKSFKIISKQAGDIKIQSIEVTDLGTSLNLKLNTNKETAYKLIHTLDNEAIFENNNVAYPNQIVFKQLNNNELKLSLIGIQNGNRLVESIPLQIK